MSDANEAPIVEPRMQRAGSVLLTSSIALGLTLVACSTSRDLAPEDEPREIAPGALRPKPSDDRAINLLRKTQRVELSSFENGWEIVEIADREDVSRITSAFDSHLEYRGPGSACQYSYQARFYSDEGEVTLLLGPELHKRNDFFYGYGAGAIRLPGERAFKDCALARDNVLDVVRAWFLLKDGEPIDLYSDRRFNVRFDPAYKDGRIYLGKMHLEHASAVMHFTIARRGDTAEEKPFWYISWREPYDPVISARLVTTEGKAFVAEGSSPRGLSWRRRFLGAEDVPRDALARVEVTVGGREKSFVVPPLRYDAPAVPPCPYCHRPDQVVPWAFGRTKEDAEAAREHFHGKCRFQGVRAFGDWRSPSFHCESCDMDY